MPLQAVALKKNRCGTLPPSNMSDNEHTAAALGYSEVLSVKNSVGELIPEFCQPSKEAGKVSSSVRGKYAGDVLPNHPLGPIFVSNGKIGEHEVATRVCQSSSEAGD